MDYDYTKTERARRYRNKLYKKGFMPAQVWIRRKDSKKELIIEYRQFVKKLKKILDGLNDYDASKLMNLFLKIAIAKKEVGKTKKRK